MSRIDLDVARRITENSRRIFELHTMLGEIPRRFPWIPLELHHHRHSNPRLSRAHEETGGPSPRRLSRQDYRFACGSTSLALQSTANDMNRKPKERSLPASLASFKATLENHISRAKLEERTIFEEVRERATI
jgi:hypothetical protein